MVQLPDPPAYLDYNATTPMDHRVFEAMTPWFLRPSNSGSRTHAFGQDAKTAVDSARAQIAEILGSESEEIIFTSGATESNNLALLGLVEFGQESGRRHILSTAIEHKAVLEPLQRMSSFGFDVELVAPTPGGYVETDEVVKRVRKDTLLISVMHANNETGVFQPIGDIAKAIEGNEVLLHVDAAQTFGKEIDELRRARPDLISVSGHKIYGPQGIGAICVRRRRGQKRSLVPLLVGGGQERGLRPGTVPVALAVGLGEAARLAGLEWDARHKHAESIRTRVFELLKGVKHRVNGELSRCQPHVLNVRFIGVDAEALMMSLRETAAISNGSACTAAAYRPSHVLSAMGLSTDETAESVRLAWGPSTTAADVAAPIAGVHQLQKGI